MVKPEAILGEQALNPFVADKLFNEYRLVLYGGYPALWCRLCKVAHHLTIIEGGRKQHAYWILCPLLMMANYWKSPVLYSLSGRFVGCKSCHILYPHEAMHVDSCNWCALNRSGIDVHKIVEDTLQDLAYLSFQVDQLAFGIQTVSLLVGSEEE